MRQLKVMTAFSGGGVVDQAFKEMGAKLLKAIEIDRRKAEEMYIPNHGDHVVIAPIEDVDPASLGIVPGEIDISWNSPVCTRYSGAQKGVETELDIRMAKAVIRHVEYLRPKAVVVENVEAYEGSIAYNTIFNGLKRLGYNREKFKLNAADYGTPQTRRRLYIVAVRSDIGHVPAIPPTHAEFPTPTLFGPALKPWVGWMEAVADLIPDRPHFLPVRSRDGRLAWVVRETSGNVRPAGKRENGLADWHEKRIKEAIGRGRLNGFFNYILDGKNTGSDKCPRQLTFKEAKEPCYTLVASLQAEGHRPRAFLTTHQEFSAQAARLGEEPSTTLTSARPGHLRAVLIPGANAGNTSPTVRTSDLPTVTVTPNVYPRGLLANESVQAVMLPGSNASNNTVRMETEPVTTLSTRNWDRALFSNKKDLRNATADEKFEALIANCTVVKFSTRMLARLQGLGDDYYLCDEDSLASECIGLGVAVQVAQAIYRAIEQVIYKQENQNASTNNTSRMVSDCTFHSGDRS